MSRNRFSSAAVLIVVSLILGMTLPVFAQGDEIEIVFWHAFGDENRSSWVMEVAEDFMAENPGVNIVVEPQASYRDTLNGAILAAGQGTAPHIVQVFEVGSQLALDSDVFIPVSSVVSEEDLATLDDIVPAVRDYYSIGDDQWSLPWNSSNAILYYNVEVFEELGLEVPTTYSEVLDVCEMIVSETELPSCIGWNMHAWFVEQWMAEQGALLANNDNGRAETATEIYLEDDAMMNIFEWWNELDDMGYYTYTGGQEDWNGSDALFTGQQVAMHLTSTADIVNITEAAEEAGFTVGTAYLPIPDDVERNGVVIGGASIWLTADHPQEELEVAAKFMLFLGNEENGVTWHQRTGYFPIRFSSLDALEADGWFEMNPNFQIAVDQLTETVAGFPNQWCPAW